MTPEQFQQFLKANEESNARSIEKYVNGDIREIKDKLSIHIENYTKWTISAQPAIDVVNNARGFSKTLMYIAAFVGAIWGTITILKK